MECLSCKHSASDELFGDPAKCPECGVYQEKARAHRERLEKMQERASSGVTGSLSREHEEVSEKASPAIEKANNGYSGKSLEALIRYPGAQPVVVVDFRMGFWSMVRFMVKLAIAAIPALLLLIFIGVGFGSFFSGFFKSAGPGKILEPLNKEMRSSKGQVAIAPALARGPVTIELVSADYGASSDDSGMLYLKLSMFSTSDKDIKAVEGRLGFADRKGNIIGVVPFSASVLIPAHRSSWSSSSIFISSILPGFTGLKAMSSDSVATFEPRQIVFSDGTVENF